MLASSGLAGPASILMYFHLPCYLSYNKRSVGNDGNIVMRFQHLIHPCLAVNNFQPLKTIDVILR